VAILIVALVFIGVNFMEGQVQTQDKPPKPPGKPDKPGKSHTEWIEFIGDLTGDMPTLVGGQPVDDCCPNAGPFPEYTMWLNFDMEGNRVPPYKCDGQLFTSGFHHRMPWAYMVQFWKKGTDVAIEIRGGVEHYDKKTRVRTVIFTDELCVDMVTGRSITEVSFTLVRRPN
jgi:hypothetical protein